MSGLRMRVRVRVAVWRCTEGDWAEAGVGTAAAHMPGSKALWRTGL